MQAGKIARTGSAAELNLVRQGATVNVAANYLDAAATVDTAIGVANNWDQLSSSERAQGMLQVAFWGTMSGVSTRASGGSLTDMFNPRIQSQQAVAGLSSTARPDETLAEGHIRINHEGDGRGLFGNRQLEVTFGPNARAEDISIHQNAMSDMISNQGVNGALFRASNGTEFSPNTRGEELAVEVSKHRALETSYQNEIDAGNTHLQPQLEQIQGALANYQGMLDVARANPDVANGPALGYVDAKVDREVMTTVADGGMRSQTADLPINVITDASLNARYPNAQYVGADEALQINGETISNLGVDLSANKSFREAGGEVFVDADSNTVILAVNMVTSRDGSKLTRVEVPYEKINGEWRADFSRHDELGTHQIRLADGLPIIRGSHFKDANIQLSKLMDNNSGLQLKLGFSEEMSGKIEIGNRGKSPKPYTWHHVNGEGDMMLVDSFIHDMFTHKGGMAEMNSNER